MANESPISLGDHLEAFVANQVRDGHYASPDEVVRAGLRLLEAHAAKVKALEDALIAGEESGDPMPFDTSEFRERMRTKYGS